MAISTRMSDSLQQAVESGRIPGVVALAADSSGIIYEGAFGKLAQGSGVGLYNTYFWLDPSAQVTGLILSQSLPFADHAVIKTFGQFEQAIYDALES